MGLPLVHSCIARAVMQALRTDGVAAHKVAAMADGILHNQTTESNAMPLADLVN